MNKLEAQLNHPRFKRQHFVKNKDGSVYSVFLFYIIEEHGKRNAGKFDGDLEKAFEWTITRYIANPVEIVAVGPVLYEEDRENFLKEATQLVAPYDDPNKVYDKANDHEFKIEYADQVAEDDELSVKSLVINADRLEVALALWENTTNKDSEYLLNEVNELHQGEVLNVWQTIHISPYERSELALVFSAQT